MPPEIKTTTDETPAATMKNGAMLETTSVPKEKNEQNTDEQNKNYEALLKAQVEQARKQAEAETKKSILEQAGYSDFEQLKQATTAYNQMLEAQKTDQEKAKEAMEKAMAEIEQHKAEVARQKAENQRLIVEQKLSQYAQEFKLMPKFIPYFVNSVKYKPSGEVISDDELRNIVKKFATDNSEFVGKASPPNVPTTNITNTNGKKADEKSPLIEKALGNMSYFSMYNGTNN